MESLDKIIRQKDADEYSGLKRSQRKELEKRGEFPQSVPLSDSGRARGYLASEIAAWQQARRAKRGAA